MKRVLTVVAVAGLIISAASCKREYTCECTVLGFKTDTTLTNVSKKEARQYCDEQSGVAGVLGGSCELK